MKKHLRVAIATTLALASVVGTRAAFSDDKPGAALAENRSVADAPAPEPARAAPSPYLVPARQSPATASTCPPAWNYFDNPALHYAICYPSGWGFTEYDAPLALTAVRSQTLGNLHLAGPEAFPWPDGDRSIDAVASRGVIDIELDLVDPSSTKENDCTPSPVRVSARTFLACEEHLDALGMPASNGPIHTLEVVFDLARPVMTTDVFPAPAGAQLVAIVRAPAAAFAKEVDLLWQLVGTIAPY
jgi:hypothetical protein